MDRKAILEQAMTIVCSDREKQYGSPEPACGRITWDTRLRATM